MYTCICVHISIILNYIMLDCSTAYYMKEQGGGKGCY